MLELTKHQAVLYLLDLGLAMAALMEAMTAFDRLATRTPAGAPPDAMLEALMGSWESLHNRYAEVYATVYGDDETGDDPTVGPRSAEAGMGQAQLQ